MSLKRVSVCFVLALAFVFGSLTWLRPRAPSAVHRQPIMGNVETLRAAYAQWREENARNGGDTRVVLPLAWSKGLSSEFTEAGGSASFDLRAQTLKVEVSAAELASDLDVWLVENV